MGFVACGQDRLTHRIAPTRVAKVWEARTSEYQAEGGVGEGHAIESLEVRLAGGVGCQEERITQFVERRTSGSLGEDSKGAACVIDQRHEKDISP